MANDLTGNPWFVDSVGELIASPVWVKRMVWANPAASGHSLLVTDAVGRTVWNPVATSSGTGVTLELAVEFIPHGLTVDSIPSGTLYIYLR